MTLPFGKPSTSMVVRLILTALVTLGLAYDAYAHFDLASGYDPIRTSTLSQGDLFRVEAAAAVLAALALLIRPRRYTALFAFAVSAAGLAAVLLYRYVDIKGFGPVPAMYEPIWYAEKTRSAYAEGVATVASAALLVVLHVRSMRGKREQIREGHTSASPWL
jgi:hypothetical protein